MQTKPTTSNVLADETLDQVTGGCYVIFPEDDFREVPPKDGPVTILPFPRIPSLPLRPVFPIKLPPGFSNKA